MKDLAQSCRLSANKFAPTALPEARRRPVSKDATADRAVTDQFSIANGGRLARAAHLARKGSKRAVSVWPSASFRVTTTFMPGSAA